MINVEGIVDTSSPASRMSERARKSGCVTHITDPYGYAPDSSRFTSTSGSDGLVDVNLLESGAYPYGSVIWVTHPDFLARSLILEAGEDVSTIPSTLIMASAPQISAHVVGPQDEPIEGATV